MPEEVIARQVQATAVYWARVEKSETAPFSATDQRGLSFLACTIERNTDMRIPQPVYVGNNIGIPVVPHDQDFIDSQLLGRVLLEHHFLDGHLQGH